MRATGIIRRIDDFGRVAIPKEIRRAMHLREGDPMEIYTNKDGEVIFKKYSLMDGLSDFATQMCDTLNRATGHIAVITDRDACIAVSGIFNIGPSCLLGKPISQQLEEVMDTGKIYRYQNEGGPMLISSYATTPFISCAIPISANDDVVGSILLATTDGGKVLLNDADYQLLKAMADLLHRYMEQ